MLRLPLSLLMLTVLAACSAMPKTVSTQPEPQVLLFDTDSAELRPASIAYLDMLSDYLNKHEQFDVVIEAHTDSTASNEYNLKLSQRRAQAVQSRLVSKGVAPERTTAVSYGEERPTDDNKMKEGRQLNRRVVVSTIERTVAKSAPVSGAPRYDYTSTDPKIAGMSHNSGVRPTHR